MPFVAPSIRQVTRALGRARRQRALKLVDRVDPLGRSDPIIAAWVDDDDVQIELDDTGGIARQECTCGAATCKHVDATWLAIARDPASFDHPLDDAMRFDAGRSALGDSLGPDLPMEEDALQDDAGDDFELTVSLAGTGAIARQVSSAKLSARQLAAFNDPDDPALVEIRAEAISTLVRHPIPKAGPELVEAVEDLGLHSLLDAHVHTALGESLWKEQFILDTWGSRRVRDVLAETKLSGAGSRYHRAILCAAQQAIVHAWMEQEAFSAHERTLLETPATGPLAESMGRLADRYRAESDSVRRPSSFAPVAEAKIGLFEDSGELAVEVSAQPGCSGQPCRIVVNLHPESAGSAHCECPGESSRPCAGKQLARLAALLVMRAPETADMTEQTIVDSIAKAPWKHALERLQEVADDDLRTGGQPGWSLSIDNDGVLRVTPVLMQPFKTRPGIRCKQIDSIVARKLIARLDRPADRQALLSWLNGDTRSQPASPELLVGHPAIVHDKELVDIAEGSLRLRWRKAGSDDAMIPEVLAGQELLGSDRLHRLWVRAIANRGFSWLETDSGQILVFRVGPALVGALWRVAMAGGTWPPQALAELSESLPALSELIDVELDDSVVVTERVPLSRPVLSLELTALQGLRVSLGVRADPAGRVLVPGSGARRIYVNDDGLTLITRDLETETARCRRVADALGVDMEFAIAHGVLRDPDDIARVAARAATLADTDVEVSWRGEPLRVVTARTADLSLRVSGGGGWLEVGAQLDVDGGAIKLLALRDALRQDQSHVVIDKHRWLKLADELVARLRLLDDRAEEGDDTLRLPSLVADALLDTETAGARIVGDAQWRSLRERIDAAGRLAVDVPVGLQADLRQYQLDGVRWLIRRATWAPGAVLADDMGLGKTLQALALLLHRRQGGPALVVAPTSVGLGWMREAARFTPDLDVRMYRGPGRAALLDDPGPGVVFVTSWDLLARDGETLGAIAWNTVVLDEAQAVKNPHTRRAKAARKLDAGFVLSLTGTPLENHIGELWSLMQVTVPGLLPGRKRFRERFETPIVRRGDRGAAASLALLVRPFILRRTKSQVATDLPDRIAISIPVELDEDQRALYEAARLDAIDRIADGEDGRFHVLAALTRLRQLACHPRLVLDSAGPTSAKLSAVREILGEVREGDHRALVFSQFTRHLAIVRDALERDGFRLCYLDGSTPAEERQRQVDRFQAGHADVFLISLKAGGTGLTLTAATYVVHLDPWWNPAVEDQATDRAHRIGQTEPVTVYRLIAQDTVEEHIVALHERKRALADSLIAGADGGATLGVDELVAIIKGAPITTGVDAPATAAEAEATTRNETDRSATATEAGPIARRDAGTSSEADPDLAEWLRRFQVHLTEEQERGAISKPLTVRNYRLAAENLVAYVEVTERPVRSPAELRDAFAEYAHDLKSGQSPVGRRTDLVFGKPAVNRWVRVLGE